MSDLDSLAKKIFDYETPKTTQEALALLRERAPLAEDLATRAFRDKDRAAWTAVQRGIFGLPIFKVSSGRQADRWRPFLRGDLVAAGIRDIVWEVEERHLERLKTPRPMVGEEAAAYIEAEFRKLSVQHHPMFEWLATAKLTDAQQKAAALAYLHSVMVRIRTVHRSIMLVSLPMEFEDAVKVAPLMVDELGAGTLEKAHAWKTAMDIERWGDKVDWHAPVTSVEMMGMLNWNLRTVTHPDQLWSFTGIFCVEWNSYLELRAGLLALRKRGVPDSMMEVLVVHGDGDPYDQDGHAKLVRDELGRRIVTPEDANQVLTGITRHQGLYHGFFEGEFAKLRAAVEKA
jgi:hypothetical protein